MGCNSARVLLLVPGVERHHVLGKSWSSLVGTLYSVFWPSGLIVTNSLNNRGINIWKGQA